MIYSAVNELVLAQLPPGSERILDLGCGSGALGRRIKEMRQCQIVGVTHEPQEAAIARAYLDEVHVADLDGYDPSPLGRFDCVICSHVLEHLRDPESLLGKLLHVLDPDGTLVVGLPNVLNWRQRWEFMRGRFRYADGGLMDRTHYRFVDWETSREMLTSAGFRITRQVGEGYFPQPVLRRIFPGLSRRVDAWFTGFLPGIFSWQIVLVARPFSSGPQPLE
jgi:2-polyprenyl-3-methyl-5-hydroxy-6-metoxy-1,4-benzoquinol methylase